MCTKSSSCAPSITPVNTSRTPYAEHPFQWLPSSLQPKHNLFFPHFAWALCANWLICLITLVSGYPWIILLPKCTPWVQRYLSETFKWSFLSSVFSAWCQGKGWVVLFTCISVIYLVTPSDTITHSNATLMAVFWITHTLKVRNEDFKLTYLFHTTPMISTNIFVCVQDWTTKYQILHILSRTE